MRNILPGCAFVIEIPTIIIYGMIADRTGSRFLVCVLPLLGNICPTMILAIYPNSDHLRVFAFMFSTTAFITAIFYTWVNEICHGSTEERGFSEITFRTSWRRLLTNELLL
jgi:ACS family pantothenate transporter-like MFS transporter